MTCDESGLEERDAELLALHRRIEELEIELAAAQGRSSERMTYGELFSACVALLPGRSFSVDVSTQRTVHEVVIGDSLDTRWRVWWQDTSKRHGSQVDGATAEAVLVALKSALINTPVPAGDPTGISDLVNPGSVTP